MNDLQTANSILASYIRPVAPVAERLAQETKSFDAKQVELAERCRLDGPSTDDHRANKLAAATLLCYCGFLTALLEECVEPNHALDQGRGYKEYAPATVKKVLFHVVPRLSLAITQILQEAEAVITRLHKPRANSTFISIGTMAEDAAPLLQIGRADLTSPDPTRAADALIIEMLTTAVIQIGSLGLDDGYMAEVCVASPRTAAVGEIVAQQLVNNNQDALLGLMHAQRTVMATLEQYLSVCRSCAKNLAIEG